MRTKLLRFFVAGFAVILFDQWTKYLIRKNFRLHEVKDIIDPIFALTYVTNRGAAFSFMATAPPQFREPFFVLLPLVAVVALIIYLIKLPEGDRWSSLSIGLIAGGAIGNLIDRVQLGFVVDFLDLHWKEVYHWPQFNVADSAIVVGVAFLFLQSLRPAPQRVK